MFECLDDKYPLHNQEKKTAHKFRQQVSLAIFKLSILKTSHENVSKAGTNAYVIISASTTLSICCGRWKTIVDGYVKKIMKIVLRDFMEILVMIVQPVNTRLGSLI